MRTNRWKIKTTAERSAAYRRRKRRTFSDFEFFREALLGAFERGASEWVTNHLPDDPAEWMRGIEKRLQGHKLVTHEIDGEVQDQ